MSSKRDRVEGIAPQFRLTLPSDPALALTARTFVVACSRLLRLDEDLCEDLRLAANELFAMASELGSAQVTLTMDSEGSLTVEGIDDLDHTSDGLPIRRSDLLRAMFPGIRQSGATIVIDRAADVGHSEERFSPSDSG